MTIFKTIFSQTISKEKAGEPDREAPPADECHVCKEDFKFLSVMDRFEILSVRAGLKEHFVLWTNSGFFLQSQVFPLQTTLPRDGSEALSRCKPCYCGGKGLPMLI